MFKVSNDDRYNLYLTISLLLDYRRCVRLDYGPGQS